MIKISLICLFSLSVVFINAQSLNSTSTTLVPATRKRQVNIPPLITLEPPREVYYREGESFQLLCSASGTPPPTYSWIWNERMFDPSGMDGRIALQPGVGTLIFAKPEPIDEAFYQCNATNIAGTALTIRVNVRIATLESFPPKSTIINNPDIGQTLTLKCLPPKSFPNPEVYWAIMTPDGSRLTPIDYTGRISQDPIGNLIFANILPEDFQNNGTYKCVALNTAMRGFQTGEPNKIYPRGGRTVLSKPEVVWQNPTQQMVLRGRTFTLKCIFSGNPTPRVSWTRATPTSKMPVGYSLTSFGQQLNVANVQYEDAGKYECSGINDEGNNPVRRSFDINVESSPYWVTKPVSLDVSEGETATFLCSGEALPRVNQLWLIDGVPVTKLNISDWRISVSEGSLTFTNMTVNDAMVIQCNISNKNGYNYTNVYLNVLVEPPIITEKPIDGQKAAEGQTIELRCSVYGAPKPYVVWIKNGEQLTGGKFSVLPTGNLQISNVSLVDAGDYTCTATNKLGFASASGYLVVRRRTKIIIKPQDMMVYYQLEAKFSCTASTDPEEVSNLQIIWKKDNQPIDYDKAERIYLNSIDNSLTISGTSYLDIARYTCKATNNIDSDQASAELIVQSPPEIPSQVLVRCYNQNNQAEIWWQPGKENYAPILNFIVQFNTSFQPDLWYDIATNLSQSQRRIMVSMSPWGNYTFRVLARNKIGVSLPSFQSFNVCTTQAGVPMHNPENVIGEGDRPGNLVIFWTPMPKIEQNGPNFKYIVQWKLVDDPNSALNVMSVGNPEAWHYIVKTTYKAYQKFNISVKANNVKGDSSAPLLWTIGYSGEDKPIVRPTNVQIVPDTLKSTKVNITFPQVDTSPDNIKGMFRGYRAEYFPTNNPHDVRIQDYIMNQPPYYPRPRIMKRQAPAPTDINFLVTNLPPNSQVSLGVRVLSKYYAGPISDRITFRTPEGVPGPPQTLSINTVDATKFIIEWVAPKEPNGVLTGYNINYQTIMDLNLGRMQYYAAPISPNATYASVPGLNPNTTYRIYLSASTKTGMGEFIFVDAVTSLAGPPNPPTFAIVGLNETFANISWTPSKSGVPGSVFYVQYRPRIHYDWLRSPDEYMYNHMTIRSLSPGTTYQVRVVANNGEGFEMPAVWQEFHTPGVAPGNFYLPTSAWFYGIWIALFFIVLGLIILILLKGITDKRWTEKEAEIEEEMRRLQAEEAANQMGIRNLNPEMMEGDETFDDQKMPLHNQMGGDVDDFSDPLFYPQKPTYQDPKYAKEGYQPPQYQPLAGRQDYSAGFKPTSIGSPKTDTFV